MNEKVDKSIFIVSSSEKAHRMTVLVTILERNRFKGKRC